MKKNGFTLVELLAVIVVLGVIMTIAGTAVMGQRRKANIEEAKNMEKTLADVGPDVYRRESMNATTDTGSFMQYYRDGTTFKISDNSLKTAGYLSKLIENPAGGGECDAAFLIVEPDSDNEMFKSYIKCGDLYTTSELKDKYGNTINVSSLPEASISQD